MAEDRRFPAWLVRRHYFKRLGRWAKPQKRAATARAIAREAEPAPSNVLPFPEQPGLAHPMPFASRLGVGTG